MQPIESYHSERIREAVRSFVRNRKTDFPISMANLTRRIRYAIPDMQCTDRDLADMVAREIVDAGGNISFDMDHPETVAHLAAVKPMLPA